MTVDLSHFVKVPNLTSGRVCYAIRQGLAAAKEAGERELAALFGQVLADAETCRGLELRYEKAPPSPLHGVGAPKADADLDRGWSRFASTLQNTAELFGLEDPQGAVAARLLGRLFPNGVAAVTSLSFIEEQESSRLLVERLRSGDLAADVATLGHQATVTRLGVLTELLGKQLGKPVKGHAPSWDEVRAARAVMQRSLVKLVARICGAFADENDESVAKRTALLDPIVEQQQRLTESYRARLGAVDVDPVTGEEETPSPLATDPGALGV